MKTISTSILPAHHEIIKINKKHELNLEAICVFVATGFFMDDDTYWKDQICLQPSTIYTLNDDGHLMSQKRHFQWHYSPRELSFQETLEEYKHLLNEIITEQVGDKAVILPLSGGLDSRSQAMVLKDLSNPVKAFSYSFDGGFPEYKIAQKIARSCGFEFNAFTIEENYLWDVIDELAMINQCFSEFTHPRQMAVLPQLKEMEGVFSLGHWGDVLFDRGVPESTKESTLIETVMKKMLKPGGFELAQILWSHWGLDGHFKDYFIYRVSSALDEVKIDNLSAKVRAFKTMQWAHRWTTTNLSVFKEAHEITLPYYDDRMLQFICTVPEHYLADRRLQIAHLKQDKQLANITWQANKPFNLYTYHYNKVPYNLPYRIVNKLHREFNKLKGRPYIQRNYELQFMGKKNDRELRRYLFDQTFLDFIPSDIVEKTYSSFKSKDYTKYSHPLSMLLTLALWHKHFANN